MHKFLQNNTGLLRAKHNMTAACRQGKTEQVYSILLDTLNCWAQ